MKKLITAVFLALHMFLASGAFAQDKAEVCYRVVSPMTAVYEGAVEGVPPQAFYAKIDELIPPTNPGSKFFNILHKKLIAMIYLNRQLGVDSVMKVVYNQCQIELAIIEGKLV